MNKLYKLFCKVYFLFTLLECKRGIIINRIEGYNETTRKTNSYCV